MGWTMNLLAARQMLHNSILLAHRLRAASKTLEFAPADEADVEAIAGRWRLFDEPSSYRAEEARIVSEAEIPDADHATDWLKAALGTCEHVFIVAEVPNGMGARLGFLRVPLRQVGAAARLLLAELGSFGAYSCDYGVAVEMDQIGAAVDAEAAAGEVICYGIAYSWPTRTSE